MRARYTPDDLLNRAMEGKETRSVNETVFGSGRTNNQKDLADAIRRLSNRIADVVNKYGKEYVNINAIDLLEQAQDIYESGEDISRSFIEEVESIRTKKLSFKYDSSYKNSYKKNEEYYDDYDDYYEEEPNYMPWQDLLYQFFEQLESFDRTHAAWQRMSDSGEIERRIRNITIPTIKSYLNKLMYEHETDELLFKHVQNKVTTINECIDRAMYDYDSYGRELNLNKIYSILFGNAISLEENMEINDMREEDDGSDYDY